MGKTRAKAFMCLRRNTCGKVEGRNRDSVTPRLFLSQGNSAYLSLTKQPLNLVLPKRPSNKLFNTPNINLLFLPASRLSCLVMVQSRRIELDSLNSHMVSP